MKKSYVNIYRVVSVMLVLLLMAGLSGCRETDVLEQIVYSNDATKIDYDKLEYLNDPDNQPDPEMNDIQDAEDEDQDDLEESDAITGDDDDQAEHVTDFTYNTDSDGSQEGHSGNTSQEEGEAQNSSGMDSDINGDNSSAQLNPTNDSTALQQVVDANGNVVKIPKNVDHVSATGVVAEYVEMLGGTGRLVASSSSFASTNFAKTVYGESVTSLWNGSGGTAMSDSEFQKLISAGPQVCLVESGKTTFTNSQISTLSQKGIYVVTVPEFNTSSNIKTGVTLLGEILGDKSSKGGENAIQNAKDYNSWYDSVINKVSSKCKRFSYQSVDYNNDRKKSSVKYINSTGERCYSLFVDSWDDSATYTVFNSEKGTVMSGKGAAATVSGYSSSPISYYMSLAGVCNLAAANEDFGTQKEWYVNGLLKGNFDITVRGKFTDYNAGTGSEASPYLTRLQDIGDTQITENFAALGSNVYKTVITASKDIKTKMAASPLMKYYPEDYSIQGMQLQTTLVGEPQYVVNPQGAALWYTGSPESPLEAMWISAQFGTGISMDEVKSEIKSFYSKFYRYNLTDSQVTAILAGI